MQYYLAISSAALKDFTWYTQGAKKKSIGGRNEYNARHPLVIEAGDVFGVKKTLRGPSAGDYQLVLGKAPHVIFRAVPAKKVDAVIKEAKPYKGSNPEKAAGVRAKKVTLVEKEGPNKQRDTFYKPRGTIVEKTTFDRDNYQWRLLVTPKKINVKTLKQGRVRGSVKDKDVIGLRYLTPAKGGYVIMPNDMRTNISHELYEELVGASRILPPARQQKGIIIAEDVKKTVGKQDRTIKRDEEGNVVRKVKKVKASDVEDAKARLLRGAKRSAYKGNNDEDFDDVPEERDDIAETNVQAHTPTALHVGSTIRSGRNTSNIFIVADVSPKGTYSEYALYNPETTKVAVIKLENATDFTRTPDIAILEKATPSETAAAIRAFNKYVKEQASRGK